MPPSRIVRIAYAGGLPLIVSLFCVAFPQTTAAPPRSAMELVHDLGNPLFAVREKATRELWALGPAAQEALETARRSPDLEVAQRAQDILNRFRDGIFPNTPPEVLRWVREFRSGQIERQQLALTSLAALGEPAFPSLRALLARDLPPTIRQTLAEHYAWVVRRELPRVLLRGEPELARELLAMHTLGNSETGLADYAAFLTREGRVAQALAELDRRGAPPSAALVLLCRAAGQAERARLLASTLATTDPRAGALLDALLEDQGDWDTLAQRAAQARGPANSREGVWMFRLRQAGRIAEADKLAATAKATEREDSARTAGPDSATLALLLAGRPLDGIERLQVRRNAPHVLAEVLAARLEFRAALEQVNLPDAAPEALRDNRDLLLHLYGTRRGKLLSQLGERTQAEAIFEELAQKLGSGREDYALAQLLRAELRAGRPDLACEHAGRFLVAADPRGIQKFGANRSDPFEAIFDGDTEAAQYWWRILRSSPAEQETPSQTMKLVRALLIGTATREERKRAFLLAEQETPRPAITTPDGYNRAMGLAAAYRAAGELAQAVQCLDAAAEEWLRAEPEPLEEAMNACRQGRGARSWLFGIDEQFRFWMELGDLWLDLGNPAQAAQRYYQGWQRHPENPILLYLAGRALRQKGEIVPGQLYIDRSHELTLGNARARGRFLDELCARGHAADARIERDQLRELGWNVELYHGNVWNQVARASLLIKDYRGAAAANRRAVHYLLRTPGLGYVEMAAYLTVPQLARIAEARAELAEQKPDAALAIAREVLAVLPANLELPLGLVPGLDQLGRTTDADQLFRSVWDRFQTMIATYPNSAWARREAAWLAAGCRRELDRALSDAQEAFRLDPEARSSRETLAEVHFRRGERPAALALMRELFAADRRNHLYRRQLARYESAPVDAPFPDAATD